MNIAKALKNYFLMTKPKTFNHFLDRSLAHVKRFNNQPQHFPESVAEHSFYVAYFTSILSSFLKKAGETIDETKAIKLALLHDMEEAISGDILNPFKHYNEEVLSAIRKVSKETVGLMFEDLPKDLSAELTALWNEDLERQSKESQVVKAADRISLIAKCYEETKAGNEFFTPIYEREFDKLYKLEYTWWQKIKDDILTTR
jgi:putative hydrolases of HD superfamily